MIRNKICKVSVLCVQLLLISAKAAEERQELSELESLPEHVIKKIGRKLSDKDLGRLILTSKRFKNILEKNLAKRGELINYWSGHDIQGRVIEKQHAASLAFCPDGNVIAYGCDIDPKVRLWDVREFRQIKELVGHADNERVKSVTFSPDGKTFFSRSTDGRIIIWDVQSSKLIRKIACNNIERGPVELLPDMSLLAAPSLDESTVDFWNEFAIKLKQAWLRPSVWLLLISKNLPTTIFAAASLDAHTVSLWDALPHMLRKEMMDKPYDLTSIVFSPNGKHVASVSYDDAVRLWNIETSEHIRLLKAGPPYVRLSATFSPDSQLLAVGPSGHNDNSIRIWRAVTGTLIHVLKLAIPQVSWANSGMTNKLIFSPDGKTLAFGCYNGDIFFLSSPD